MNIYLHPSGVKKELKNDYIGEYDFAKYQEVEYIQSSWTNWSSWQYINTWIIPEPSNTVVKLRTMPISSSYSIYLCSCMKTYGTAQTNRYYWLSFAANRWHCWYWTADTTPWHPLVDFSYTWNWWNTIYDVEYRNDDLYVNNTLVANATTNVSNFQYPMFLFARNNDGTAGSFSSFKLYSCKIYKSWTLVRNFVPCYRKSDSVIWLYDLVNKQFYTNAGSWTFTKWPDVN